MASIYAREIQNRLLLKGICDRDKLPSESQRKNRDDSGEVYKCAERIDRQQ